MGVRGGGGSVSVDTFFSGFSQTLPCIKLRRWAAVGCPQLLIAWAHEAKGETLKH